MAPVLILDDAARARLLTRFGPEAAAWCDELPARVARLARRWGLTVEAALSGNTGRTLRCRTRDGALVVLKLCPDTEITRTEATALRAWADCPQVVDVVNADVAEGALLLAGIEPGTPLSERGWRPEEIDDLLPRLHAVPAPPGIPSLTDRVRQMFALAAPHAEGRVPAELMEASLAASLALAADDGNALLHGDLHPANVLAGADGPVVIDPRPCAGDPAFDTVDWVLLPGRDLDDAVAALPSFDPGRVQAWARAIAVLAALGPLRRQGRSAFTDSLLALSASLT
ncbi:aminoglycoside phosphotransferase family protein [Amycolatopsis dongchuanensis]|uniref:Aminoglycoside phosphotransferase family protein n=1 Tax=Amycolatopsis dongchuanensis TaxID=1070866 RepID=A0ABP9QVZ7_9PSEU